MDWLSDLYGHRSLALLTDLYQLTMSYGYWKSGVSHFETVFHHFYRTNPFGGGYTVACGLDTAISFVEHLRFSDDDIEYLAGLTGSDNQPLFEPAFLDYLQALRFDCDIDAVPEGTAVFPHEPLVRVRGPIIPCQLIESALLCIINFQTLIATKSSRVCRAAQGEPVLEFGLRRAHSIDGALSASRAAYIGGCRATSNVLAGKLLGIPVRGTHAHSWVMLFDSEQEAFQRYADAMPNNCTLLVDTYDTEQGVRTAIEVAEKLRAKGGVFQGVRLDSGDLAALSNRTRELLDEAGFDDASIVASNDLDEHSISALKRRNADINVWGVGTKLITSYDQPALGGVYKLSAVRKSGKWDYRVKRSEERIKVSLPGMLQVRRFSENGKFVADCIFDENIKASCLGLWYTPDGQACEPCTRSESEDLLRPVLRQGKRINVSEDLTALRARAAEQLNSLAADIQRFESPAQYCVALDEKVHDKREALLSELPKSGNPDLNPAS